jgi:hypothetical protein
MPLEARHELEGGLANGVDEAGLPLEGGIGLDETVVDGEVLRTRQDLEHAEPLIDRVEERPVLVGAQNHDGATILAI